MRFTDIFIARPVLALVVSGLVVMLGIMAGGKLAVREYPELESSVINVRTVYPGASARVVQGFVTTPLQKRIAAAKGVEYITSQTDPGVSSIDVHVRLGENSTGVQSEVIAKINEAKYELPRAVEDPIVSNRSTGDALMYIAFISKQMSVHQIYDFLLRSVQPELSTIEGVGEATIHGDRALAMRVWLDPARMAAFGVTPTDVSDAITEENFMSAAGTTRGALVRTSVDAETDLRSAREFADIVIRQDGDLRIRMGDVARVELAAASSDSLSFSSGRETVYVSIRPAPGANPLDVAARVKEALPRLARQLPADMEMSADFDGSIYISQAVREVVATLLEAAVIVVVVILLFLGSMRVVAIPLVAIPLSLVGVLFLVWMMGFSINLLTLLAMVISIGLVVDDAIVVVENVHRHIEDGHPPLQAALEGARQVAMPVVAMTLTLAAVYLPIGFMGGLTGALFSEFALTLAGAVVVSGVIALTLSPVMCAHVLSDSSHQGRAASWLDARFRSLRSAYRRALSHCVDNGRAVALFAVAIIASLPLLFALAQQELAPEEDTGSLFIVGTTPDYSSIDYTNRFVGQMVAAWKSVPESKLSWQVNSSNLSFGGVDLVPWEERERSQQAVQKDLQKAYAAISGMEFYVSGWKSLPGADSGLPVNFVIATTGDYAQLEQTAEDVLARARQSGLFAFVNKTLRYSRPEIGVSINRHLAQRLGVSMEDIGKTLQVMLGEAETNRFNIEGRSYKVITQAEQGFRLSKEWLQRYYVRTASGTLIPLATVIELAQRVEPNRLSQFQQLNSVTIQGIMMPPNSLGAGLDFLQRALDEVAPQGYRSGHEGESRRFLQEKKSFAPLFAASLVFIFLVLSAQFNSFRDPLAVLVSVPLSMFGAVVPLALGWATLNIYTQVGLLTLIGLISKHGILIVDFAEKLREQGFEAREAVLEAAALRLRPILMTTFATVLGVLPLMLAVGAGAASRFAIGLMIAAGMVVGTLFTLFVLPNTYLLLTAARSRRDVPAL